MTGEPRECPSGWDPAKLLAYVEAALDDEERLEVQAHIEECSWCRGEAEALGLAHGLLLKHPQAFHPEAEELVRFAYAGEAADSAATSHVETCIECTEDVEFIRRMLREGFALADAAPRMPRSLMAKLESESGVRDDAPRRTRVLSWITGWWEAPLRAPIFALGTAAAVVLIAVLVVPRPWIFKEVSKIPLRVPVQEPVPTLLERTKQRPHERDAGRGEPSLAVPSDKEKGAPVGAREEAEGKEAFQSLQDVVPLERKRKEPAVAGEPEERAVPENPVPRAQPVGPTKVTDTSAVVSKKTASVPVSSKLEQRQRVQTVQPASRSPKPARDSAKVGAIAEYSAQPAKPALRSEVGDRADGKREPIEVRIVDAEGNEIPWLKYSGQPGEPGRVDALDEMKTREAEGVGHREKDAFRRFSLGMAKEEAPRGLLILIRVEHSGGAYDLEAKLIERAAEKVLRTIREEKVAKPSLHKRIDGLIRRLIQTPS